MALRGVAAHINGGISTSNAVTVTGIPSAGDIIILAAQWTGASATFGLPSGFATIPGLSNQNCAGTTTMMALAYKVADGTETTLTVTSSSNNLSVVVARIYSGRNTTTPFTDAQVTANTAGTTPITYALTGVTAAPSDDVVEFVANQYYQGSPPGMTAPPGFGTARVDQAAITNVPILASCDYQGTPAGLTGTNGGRFTCASTGLAYAAQQISIAALNPATLTAVNGAIALTGQAVGLGTGIAATAGAFTLTGQTALLFVGASGYQLTAAPGSFVMIGANAAEGLELAAAAGVFSLGGFDVGLAGHLFITGEVGAFTLNGNFATFLIGGVAVATVRVRAVQVGYYGQIRNIGDVFDVSTSFFTDSTVDYLQYLATTDYAGGPMFGWMQLVPPTTPLQMNLPSPLSSANVPRLVY